MGQQQVNPQRDHRRSLPSWAINLGGFGLLIVLILALFAWQMTTVHGDLQRNALGRSRMIAAIIEQNLANATLAGETVDTVVTSFLLDKARFIEYLDAIDPLQPEELAALAKETGLLGITLAAASGRQVDGPSGWFATDNPCGLEPGRIHYDGALQIGLLVHLSESPERQCIRLGIDARPMLRLHQQTALPALLATLSGLPGMAYVRLEESMGEIDSPETVELSRDGGRRIAEVRVPTAQGRLIIGLDATNHYHREAQIRRQFVLFSALLLCLGLFFSWLLYRYQQADISRTRTFERILAREHEAAALGRATATIAHEVRNPLNAISMGLQRLTMESAEISGEQRQLIEAMNEAVRRASTIVGELQRFTRPLRPVLSQVQPVQLLRHHLALLQTQLDSQGLSVDLNEGSGSLPIAADPDLLSELLANLLSNSIEAQPSGGAIAISLASEGDRFHLRVTNGGCTLAPEEIQRLGEPYFTTKTRGTGLGLALCRRIAEAHGGQLHCSLAAGGRLTVSVTLPVNGGRLAGSQQATGPEREENRL